MKRPAEDSAVTPDKKQRADGGTEPTNGTERETQQGRSSQRPCSSPGPLGNNGAPVDVRFKPNAGTSTSAEAASSTPKRRAQQDNLQTRILEATAFAGVAAKSSSLTSFLSKRKYMEGPCSPSSNTSSSYEIVRCAIPTAYQNNLLTVVSPSSESDLYCDKGATFDDSPVLSSYDANIVLVNAAFKVVAVCGIITWLTLLTLVYILTPKEYFVPLTDLESSATTLGAILIFMSAACKCIPLVLRSGWKSLSNGIMIGALSVQLIAFTTDALMAIVKVPVKLDPVSGAQVYLFRYCAWTPLAFMMTFFTEALDVPTVNESQKLDSRFSRNWRVLKAPILHGLAQGVSAFQGWVFPLCPGLKSWMVSMTISCVLYIVIFPRLYYKRKLFKAMQRGTSVDDIETYDRARLSYNLLITCGGMWTILVFMYFFQSFAPWFAPKDSILQHKSLPFICEAVIDVMSKALYLDVIVDLHSCVFDDGMRSVRRLRELQRMMSVVWECTTDIIILSVRGRYGTVTTMLSPSFLKLEGLREHRFPEGLNAVIFEQRPSEFTGGSTKVNTRNDFIMIDITNGRRIYPDQNIQAVLHKTLTSVRKLVLKSWGEQFTEALMIHDVELLDGTTMHCEGKLTKLESNALIVVTRDISERYRRFEAEKRAVSEQTARRKDAEANRFTRHEVKNGLLASIALCDSLRETACPETGEPLSRAAVKNSAVAVQELETTLQEVLDTVMAEAMARDVIHEVYEPRMERVDLCEVLTTSHRFGKKGMHRFPIVTFPSPLPIFMFDPQLLRYIHRNAVSNACKYGGKGGVVLTEVTYRQELGEIQLNVVNFPGDNHKEILELGEAAQDAVFAVGKRLHSNMNIGGAYGQAALSSGDGAWISQKCARTLGGECSIKFYENKTVFTLRCPAKPFELAKKVPLPWDPSKFKLPEGTVGIAVEDSRIQRKLMGRFFSLLGVPAEMQFILGERPEEIRSFNDEVIRIMTDNPASKILLIADENLDVVEDATHHQTVSGSLCIQKLRVLLSVADESRLLALIRSANDSSLDVSKYKWRAHGFFPKAPIKREVIAEVLSPLWEERFPGTLTSERGVAVVDATEFVSSVSDLMQTLDFIDALCYQNETIRRSRWPLIWDKLHTLKGDLMTFRNSQQFHDVLHSIDDLKGPSIPDDFQKKWKSIHSTIVRIIDVQP